MKNTPVLGNREIRKLKKLKNVKVETPVKVVKKPTKSDKNYVDGQELNDKILEYYKTNKISDERFGSFKPVKSSSNGSITMSAEWSLELETEI